MRHFLAVALAGVALAGCASMPHTPHSLTYTPDNGKALHISGYTQQVGPPGSYWYTLTIDGQKIDHKFKWASSQTVRLSGTYHGLPVRAKCWYIYGNYCDVFIAGDDAGRILL